MDWDLVGLDNVRLAGLEIKKIKPKITTFYEWYPWLVG